MNMTQKTGETRSISRARTHGTGRSRLGGGASVRSTRRGAPSRGLQQGRPGDQALPRGSAWGQGGKLLRGRQGQPLASPPPRLPARRGSKGGGPEVPALRLGVAAAGGRGPQECRFTSVSDGSPHPATAASTPQIWPKTPGCVKASGFRSGPLGPASRRRRELEGSAGVLGGAEGLGAEPRGVWGGARGVSRASPGQVCGRS